MRLPQTSSMKGASFPFLKMFVSIDDDSSRGSHVSIRRA